MRDLVCQHASGLSGLVAAYVQRTDPGLAQAFGQQMEACRTLGPAQFSSWLYGVTLRLLRDSLGKGLAELSDFALRFLREVPPSLARPMITLALSSISYVACTIYLCKPACAAARDILLPSDWKACVDRNLQ
ncbi:hypothetical protein JL37_28480 [Achromobacter sp. RTa]|uniref:hypothetical protein n=1 Tax=Achromobacter sp. RTa TaxID=1532557 RepID=UPI00050EED06|nr:hypothetical protein [Achromobacter sp. RTa]KGD86848.1 hypothetical protein JL37_28480 [Achromobacter sp. RTa]